MELQRMGTQDVMTIADVFSKSGMFPDTKTANQAFVKIMAGQEMGIPPFASITGVHIIKGKPTIGAGIMASTVKGSAKYDYKVLKLDNKVCEVEFFEGKKSLGISKFTDEDAKIAGTQNMGKFPKNMLFARAMSNGVKWYCPDVFSGPVYVPEEMGVQETEDGTYEEVIDVTVALQDIDAAETLEQLQSVWSAYKSLQTDPEFAAKKDQRKAELSKPIDDGEAK